MDYSAYQSDCGDHRLQERHCVSVQAGGADAAGVERVPIVAAGARPEVAFSWRPAAQRTTDVRPGSVAALIESRVDYGSDGHMSDFTPLYVEVNRNSPAFVFRTRIKRFEKEMKSLNYLV